VTVVGVDPGGAATGIAVISNRNRYLSHALILRNGWPTWGHYVRAVVAEIEPHLDAGATVGVEDVTPPTPHMGLISVRGLLDTARMVGALHYRLGPGTVLVPPGGHGSLPAEAYPSELIGPREGKALSGRLRHCRSAWDVACATRKLSL